MEEEMKKKRNKKKKRKQGKAAEDIAVDAGETASLDQNHETNGQDDNDQVSETADTHNDVQNINVNLNGHLPNGTEVASLEERVKELQNENESHIKKEATLEETIKQLQQKNHSYLQKEASLEETVKVFLNENESHIKKEATFEDTIKQLQQKYHSYVQKEASLEETIKVLQNENESHIKKEVTLEETSNKLQHECQSYIQKKAGLQMIIVQLRNENDSLLEKEAALEDKISRLLEEKANLGLKGASLEERVKHLEGEKNFWILKENSTRETLANLHVDATKLQAQVVELEEFRSNLLQENQRLMDIISGLQSQIQKLERSTSSTSSTVDLKMHGSEHEDLSSQMEAGLALIEKLMTENAELIEKVNELYVELDRRIATDGLTSATGSVQMFETTETASFAYPISESNEDLSLAGKKMESIEVVPMNVENIEGDNVDVEHAAVIPTSVVSEETGEIAQISMDESEIRDTELQAANNDEKNTVLLSDAPLVGAPFRLISFVTRYVSGADLVNKNLSH